MRNVSDKYYGENLNTYFMFNNLFFGNSAVYEIRWKNVAEPDSPHMIIRRMRLACWITKVTNTHSEYVILIAFLLHQFLHECASLFCYTYIACLVICHFCYAQNNYIIVILILRCFTLIMEMIMIYQF